MKAYKCDRCGAMYEHYPLANDYHFKGGIISVCSVTNGGVTCKEILDLCEGCRKDLVDFMYNAKDESIEVETKEKSEEAVVEKVKSIGETLEALGYVNNPSNKDKINREAELYPCKKCIHYKDDDGGCNIGAGFKCLREPEKYWKPKED